MILPLRETKMIELSLCPSGPLHCLVSFSQDNCKLTEGLITVCDMEQRCSHHLPITLRSLCRPSPPPFWTLHISLPFAKGSWEPNGKPERWFLAQTIHRSILSSLGEFWDYRSMRLDYKSYLISQTHIAYISLCGSSRASSVVFLVVWSRGCQLYCLGQWPNIYQRLENSRLCHLQAKQGFVTAPIGQRPPILLAASLKCSCLEKELARAIFPYFAEVAKTAVSRCSR